VGLKTIDWMLGDALRVDGQGWKALRPEEPLIKQLRLLCRDEVRLIEQRTALINQLRHALAEYYPAALEAFEDWTSVSAWMFLQRFLPPSCSPKPASDNGRSSCTLAGSGAATRGLVAGDLR
jgi:Transposase